MALEIERKFLTTSDAWREQAVHSERIVDGLLAASQGRKVRVRLYADRATLAIKTRRKGRVRFEFEYAIPTGDARYLLETECGRSTLAKTRHYVIHAGKTWEIDEYEAPLEGVVLAEVELSAADEDLALPHWVGREVTEDPAFRKTRFLTEHGQRTPTPRRPRLVSVRVVAGSARA